MFLWVCAPLVLIGVKSARAIPKARPLMLTFYTPSRVYVGNTDPVDPPLMGPYGSKYWLNGVTAEMFAFNNDKWERLIGRPYREFVIGESPIGHAGEDPDGPCDLLEDSDPAMMDSWLNALPPLGCASTFTIGGLEESKHVEKDLENAFKVFPDKL